MQDQHRKSDLNAWLKRFRTEEAAPNPPSHPGEFLKTFHQEFSSLAKRAYHGAHPRTAVILPEHLNRALRAVDRQIVSYVNFAGAKNWPRVEGLIKSLLALCISSSSDVRKAAFFGIRDFLIPDLELHATYDPSTGMPSLILISTLAWHTELRLRANEAQSRLLALSKKRS